MDMQDKRIRLPRIHNFGDDSMPVHAIASHNRSQYDNSEEDYSMSEIQQTAKKLQAKYEHSRALKRNHFKEDIDTTDWDDIEPSFDDEPQVPKQSLNTLQKKSRDSLKAFLNGANAQSERKGAQNSSVRNRHLNLSEQKDPRTTADFANIAPGELHRSLLAIEEKGRANRAYYANKSHIVSNEGYGDSEPTIPIRILQDSLLEDSYASRTPPPFEVSNTPTPAAFEHRNVENKRHELMVLPEIQEKEKSTQEFSTEATPKPSTHEPIDDSKRYKSAPRNSRPARNFLIPLEETPAQEEAEPKDRHSLLTHKPEKAVTQRVIRRQKPVQKSPLELPAPIVQRQRKPGVPRFAHPEKKNSVAQAVNNSDIIGGEVEKVWPVNKREGTVRNLSEQKNPSSSIISQGESNSRNKVTIKENRNASVEMGKVKKPTSEKYMSEKVEYMFVLHDKSRTENELMQQNNLIKKQIVQFRDLLQNLADKAEGKKKKLPPGKLGWLMEEVKASKQVYDNLQEEYKKLQAQTSKANNSDYLLTLEKEIQKVREAKKREEREKRNMELLDKKELYTNKGKASNRGHGSSEADTINRVNLMQEARDRLKRQHSKLREKNEKAQETRAEQDENLKKLEEKYSKLLGASQGPGQGWTGADILKFEEAKKRGEKVEELNKKIAILNKAIAQQERYQEGVTEVLRKEAECEAKFLEQNTKELDRKQYALELLNMDIQKIVMESPIFNEIKGRSYDAEADDQQILKNLVTGVKTTERKTGENEDEDNNLKQVLKDREIDFVIAEMKRREARKLTKQASSKESSRSPDSEKKSKERTPLKSQPESDYEEEDSLMEVEEKTHRRKNKVKEEVKKAKNKKVIDEPKPREPKPPVPKFSKPKKPEIKVTSPKEHKEKESRRTSMGSVVEPDSLDNSPVRQLTDKIKESLLEMERKNNEAQVNVVNENEEIKKEELKKKVEEALKPKYEVKTEVKVKTPKKTQEIKEVEKSKDTKDVKDVKDIKEVKPAKEVKEEVPLQVKKSQEVKEQVEKPKEINGGKEEVKTVKEVKEALPVETKKSLEIKPKAKIDKRESKEEVDEDIPEYKEFKPLQSGKETKREIKEENVFKEPEIIQKPKETKQIFEIKESIKEEDEEKSALTLKPQLFRSKKTDNNKPIVNPLDLKLKDSSTDMFSIKPNNTLPDSNKELVMSGSTNSRTLVLETNNAKRPLDRASYSNIPMTESKEVAMPGLLPNKIPRNTTDLVLPDKSPEKSSTVKDEPLELPIAITGVSRRNRFGQAPRAGMESKQESLDEKPVINQDNSKLSLDFLKQSSQSPDPGKRDRGDGLDFSTNKDNINANQPLVSPFKAPEEKSIGRRRQISNIPEDKTPPKKDSLDDIFGFDSGPVKEEQEKDKNIFGKPAEKAVGFGLGFGLGMSDEPKKSIGGFGGGQISSVNTGTSSGGDDIARGAQARNRLARLKRGDDAKPVEEIVSFNVENNKGSSILESGRKDITKTVDPFSKFDDISSLNIEAKGKDLFGNRDNKPMMFGKGEEKKDNRNDLGSFLDAQFESKQEESIGNARRMRMNQKDRSVNIKEKESVLAVKAQQKENKFFGDIDLDDF